jgi:hypothetical protein
MLPTQHVRQRLRERRGCEDHCDPGSGEIVKLTSLLDDLGS